MATERTREIVQTPDVVGGKPRIAGRRISVPFVHARVKEADIPPEQVAEQHDLSLAQVYDALAYYYANLDEMESLRQEREETIERLASKEYVATGPSIDHQASDD